MACEFNEPWQYTGSNTVTVRDRFDNCICRMHWPNATAKGTFEVDEAKAFRMISTVNACVGITTAALDDGVISDLWFLKHFVQLHLDGADTMDDIISTLKKIDEKLERNPMTPKTTSETVTVCSLCLQASCWQGKFMCHDSDIAGTVEKTIPELEALGLEHPSYWEESK
jgi:hypothetical protein